MRTAACWMSTRTRCRPGEATGRRRRHLRASPADAPPLPFPLFSLHSRLFTFSAIFTFTPSSHLSNGFTLACPRVNPYRFPNCHSVPDLCPGRSDLVTGRSSARNDVEPPAGGGTLGQDAGSAASERPTTRGPVLPGQWTDKGRWPSQPPGVRGPASTGARPLAASCIAAERRHQPPPG